MKREILKEMGLTDEQIEKIMAENGKDVQTANSKAEKYKTEAEKAAELKAKLDEIEAGSLSEIEKANKDMDLLKQKNLELESQISEMKFKSSLADKGIIGQQAESIVKSFMGGDFDTATNTISQIISDREAAAAVAKEQEIAKNSTDPMGGGHSENKNDKKSGAEKNL